MAATFDGSFSPCGKTLLNKLTDSVLEDFWNQTHAQEKPQTFPWSTGVNRMFHVLKTPVYRFDLYGRYDENNFS